jgi:hypothetical protein
METKQTPKQQVQALYPSAAAVKDEDGRWLIMDHENAHPDYRVLGSNGSATGAWANAAKRLLEDLERAASLTTKPEHLEESDKRQSVFDTPSTHEIAPGFTTHGTQENADRLEARLADIRATRAKRTEHGFEATYTLGDTVTLTLDGETIPIDPNDTQADVQAKVDAVVKRTPTQRVARGTHYVEPKPMKPKNEAEQRRAKRKAQRNARKLNRR